MKEEMRCYDISFVADEYRTAKFAGKVALRDAWNFSWVSV